MDNANYSMGLQATGKWDSSNTSGSVQLGSNDVVSIPNGKYVSIPLVKTAVGSDHVDIYTYGGSFLATGYIYHGITGASTGQVLDFNGNVAGGRVAAIKVTAVDNSGFDYGVKVFYAYYGTLDNDYALYAPSPCMIAANKLSPAFSNDGSAGIRLTPDPYFVGDISVEMLIVKAVA